MRRASLLFLLLAAVPAAAQTREPLPKFAIDLHAATVGLPIAEGWVPVVPADTVLPGRGWGFAGVGTVYLFRAGVVTFGFGASLSRGSGQSEPPVIAAGTGTTAALPTTPIVHTSIINLTPQLSINFGHQLGWSYLSAGLGRSKVTSSAEAVGRTPAIAVPVAWNQAINVGGGARWFMKEHLGAGFDVRFVKLGSRGETARLPSAKRTQMWTISAGISIQ